jgi:hypothetical protein
VLSLSKHFVYAIAYRIHLLWRHAGHRFCGKLRVSTRSGHGKCSAISPFEFRQLSAILEAMTTHLNINSTQDRRRGDATQNDQTQNDQTQNDQPFAPSPNVKNGPLAKFSQNATILRTRRTPVRPNGASAAKKHFLQNKLSPPHCAGTAAKSDIRRLEIASIFTHPD